MGATMAEQRVLRTVLRTAELLARQVLELEAGDVEDLNATRSRARLLLGRIERLGTGGELEAQGAQKDSAGELVELGPVLELEAAKRGEAAELVNLAERRAANERDPYAVWRVELRDRALRGTFGHGYTLAEATEIAAAYWRRAPLGAGDQVPAVVAVYCKGEPRPACVADVLELVAGGAP